MHLNAQEALHFLSAHAGACMRHMYVWYNMVQLGAYVCMVQYGTTGRKLK